MDSSSTPESPSSGWNLELQMSSSENPIVPGPEGPSTYASTERAVPHVYNGSTPRVPPTENLLKILPFHPKSPACRLTTGLSTEHRASRIPPAQEHHTTSPSRPIPPAYRPLNNLPTASRPTRPPTPVYFDPSRPQYTAYKHQKTFGATYSTPPRVLPSDYQDTRAPWAGKALGNAYLDSPAPSLFGGYYDARAPKNEKRFVDNYFRPDRFEFSWNKPFPFMELPRELRDEIYSCLLIVPGEINPFPIHSTECPKPAPLKPCLKVMRISKIVKAEAEAILYTKNIFRISGQTASNYLTEKLPCKVHLGNELRWDTTIAAYEKYRDRTSLEVQLFRRNAMLFRHVSVSFACFDIDREYDVLDALKVLKARTLPFNHYSPVIRTKMLLAQMKIREALSWTLSINYWQNCMWKLCTLHQLPNLKSVTLDFSRTLCERRMCCGYGRRGTICGLLDSEKPHRLTTLTKMFQKMPEDIYVFGLADLDECARLVRAIVGPRVRGRDRLRVVDIGESSSGIWLHGKRVEWTDADGR